MMTTQGQKKKYISHSDKICLSITARHCYGMKNVLRDRTEDRKYLIVTNLLKNTIKIKQQIRSHTRESTWVKKSTRKISLNWQNN